MTTHIDPVAPRRASPPHASCSTPPLPITAAEAATPSDPAFAAVQALDVAAEAWSAAYVAWADLLSELDPHGLHDWGDSAAVARAALGGAAKGTIGALADYERRLAALEIDVGEAEARFRATAPASELGAAAMRAAARRYGRRPGGWAGDEAALMGT